MRLQLWPEVSDIVLLSILVSGSATVIASFFAIPFGIFLSLFQFKGRRFLILLLHAVIGVPTVVVGLCLYFLLSRHGPLGWLGWLFTPAGMIVAQAILIFPIITSFAVTHLLGKTKEIKETAIISGATYLQLLWTFVLEARLGIIGAVVGGFARAIGEVGAAMMVGGNIRHFTRVMTTAIALETGKGDFELAISLGMVLILVSLGVSFLLFSLERIGEFNGRDKRS